jgi:hypothetical protein
LPIHPESSKAPAFKDQTPQLEPKTPQLQSEYAGKIIPEKLKLKLKNLTKRSNKEELTSLICELCSWQPLAAQQLAELLNRKDKKYLVRQHLSPLVKKGALKHVYPERGTSPNQAYTAH